MMPRVAAVVLNWENWPDTRLCLESLTAQAGVEVETTVVDNGSADDSLQQIQAWVESHPGQIAFLPEAANRGFSAGMNAGIRQALRSSEAGWILLSNSDILFPQKDCLRRLVELAQSNTRIGCVWPRTVGPEGRTQVYPARLARSGWDIAAGTRLGGLFLRRKPRLSLPDQPAPTETLDGSCFLLRRELLKALGPLDDCLFLRGEELVLAKRIADDGRWTIWMHPQVTLLHRRSRSIRRLPPARSWIESVRGEWIYARDYLGLPARGLCLLRLYRVGGFACRLLFHQEWKHTKAFVQRYLCT